MSIISPVKREKIKKAELLLKRTALRANLPILTREEIRRHRLNYYEAINEDLVEQGFKGSADYLKQLYAFQAEYKETRINDSMVQAQTNLKDSKKDLDIIYNAFRLAETAHIEENVALEIDEFLKLSIYYAFGPSEWNWLAEQLFLQCIDISSNYFGDGSRRSATCNYIFAMFLNDNKISETQAIAHLVKAREMSIGHLWSAFKELNRSQKSIFTEVCSLIYQLMVREIKDLLKYDPITGHRLCILARKRAEEACIKKGEIFLLQGQCEMGASQPMSAAESFLKALLIFQNEKNIDCICEATLQLALAYLQMGNWTETSSHLENLLKFAELNDKPSYVGQAYLYLGEYNLNNGNPQLASPLLVRALQIFHELKDYDRREQVKNLAAVSKGQEIIKQYVSYIISCGRQDKIGRESLDIILRWKDSRTEFWLDENGSLAIFNDDDFDQESLVEQEVIEEIYVDYMEGDKPAVIKTESTGTSSGANSTLTGGTDLTITDEKLVEIVNVDAVAEVPLIN